MASASNARNLFNITLEMKEIILKYLHVNLPIPKITLGKQNSWSLDLSHKYLKIKRFYGDIYKYFYKEEDKLPHVTKIGKVNQVELDSMMKNKITSINREFDNYNYNYHNDFSNLNYSYNSTVTDNIINNVYYITTIEEPYIKFLTYLFNEFNLFI